MILCSAMASQGGMVDIAAKLHTMGLKGISKDADVMKTTDLGTGTILTQYKSLYEVDHSSCADNIPDEFS